MANEAEDCIEVFDIGKLDISDPKQVHEFKSFLVKQSFLAAQEGEVKVTAAYKNTMELLVEGEKRFNVIREEKLKELEDIINEIEIMADKLAGENMELRAKLGVKK